MVTILDGAHSIKIKIKIEPLGQDSGFTVGMIDHLYKNKILKSLNILWWLLRQKKHTLIREKFRKAFYMQENNFLQSMRSWKQKFVCWEAENINLCVLRGLSRKIQGELPPWAGSPFSHHPLLVGEYFLSQETKDEILNFSIIYSLEGPSLIK